MRSPHSIRLARRSSEDGRRKGNIAAHARRMMPAVAAVPQWMMVRFLCVHPDLAISSRQHVVSDSLENQAKHHGAQLTYFFANTTPGNHVDSSGTNMKSSNTTMNAG